MDMEMDATGLEVEIEVPIDEAARPKEIPVEVAPEEAPAAAEPGIGRSPAVPADRGPLRDGLQLYLAWIRDIPLLDREAVSELSETIDVQEARFRHAMNALPAAAVLLLERWSARKAASHTTATFAHGYQSDVGRDWASEIDVHLESLREIASTARVPVPAIGAGADDWRAARASMSRALGRDIDGAAHHMRAADILLEVLIEIHGDLAATIAETHDGHADDAAAALGLRSRQARSRLAAATKALEQRKRAVQTLASHNLRLVIRSAKRFRNLGLPMMDLIQEGNAGLLRAVEKFDHTKGFTFSTYAVWWIDQALIRAVQNQSRTVRVPGHVHQMQRKVRAAEQFLRSRLWRDPSDAELAEALQIEPAQLERASASAIPIQSLDEPVADEARTNLVDSLAAPADEEPCTEMDRDRVREILIRGLSKLGEREREIIEMRFGLGGDEPLTLREIGQRKGLSRERVRQIEVRSLETLREQTGIRALACHVEDDREAA